MKRLINKILFGLTLTGGSLGLHSCGDWLDINSNELAATKTEAGYLFNYAAINYSSKRVGGDQWLPIIYAAQVASDADNWFVGDDMYNISTYVAGTEGAQCARADQADQSARRGGRGRLRGAAAWRRPHEASCPGTSRGRQ